MQRRIAVTAVIATGLLGLGMSTASAHTGVLQASGQCQDDGTRLVTYTGTTQSVPAEGAGHQATLTVGEILPSGTQASPGTQTVTGNTTFTFTQSISGDAQSSQATAFLVWGDGAKSDPIGQASFTSSCTPKKPTPEVVVTPSEVKNCDSKIVTITTVTTTTDWVLKDSVWVKDVPVSTQVVTTRETTPEECPVTPPVVTPPVVTPPVVTPPVVTPPVVTPPVVTPPVVVAGVEAVANPLPVSAAAGDADTSGQLVVGGMAALGGLLMLGVGFMLRRRHGAL